MAIAWKVRKGLVLKGLKLFLDCSSQPRYFWSLNIYFSVWRLQIWTGHSTFKELTFKKEEVHYFWTSKSLEGRSWFHSQLPCGWQLRPVGLFVQFAWNLEMCGGYLAAVVVWQNTLRSKEDLNPKGVVLLGFLQQLHQNLTLGHKFTKKDWRNYIKS